MAVGELAGQCREQEEGQDEQPAGDRREGGFLPRVIVDPVDHQHDHRGAEQIIVEGAQELGREQRQEPAFGEKPEGRGHAGILRLIGLSVGIARASP